MGVARNFLEMLPVGVVVLATTRYVRRRQQRRQASGTLALERVVADWQEVLDYEARRDGNKRLKYRRGSGARG